MAAAHVGVEPKQAAGFANEALSTKILEFMACGVPVVASRTRIHAYYFTDEVIRFFAPEREDELAAALLDMHDRYSEWDDWVDRAREFAAGFAWQLRVREYIDLVESLGRPLSTRRAVANRADTL
jgi:glycosyltransferase involved in cell wall biosynthesis